MSRRRKSLYNRRDFLRLLAAGPAVPCLGACLPNPPPLFDIPGEIVIKFKDGTDLHSIKAIQKRLDLTTIKVVPKLNIYRMKIMNGSSVEEVMKHLQGFSEVEYSEPNYIVDFQ